MPTRIKIKFSNAQIMVIESNGKGAQVYYKSESVYYPSTPEEVFDLMVKAMPDSITITDYEKTVIADRVHLTKNEVQYLDYVKFWYDGEIYRGRVIGFHNEFPVIRLGNGIIHIADESTKLEVV